MLNNVVRIVEIVMSCVVFGILGYLKTCSYIDRPLNKIQISLNTKNMAFTKLMPNMKMTSPSTLDAHTRHKLQRYRSMVV
jgi:hypothetical protein